MGRCVNCGNLFSDEVLFCPQDGQFALLDVILKDTYLIKEKLGEGGMAMVFKATNVLTNSICAIKIIHPDMLESELNAVERLLLEAVKIKKIAHPNIVKVLDFGPLNDGELVYLTMELLKGRTLKQEITEKGPINYKKAAFLIEQVCAAIGAAHERGIIHRDIKPENIFLLEDIKDNILLKVLDFGISTDHVTHFTGAAKQIIGTPEYMSPEQCEAHKNLDIRSDIYSLGVTLYEMLTGRVPFPIAFWEPYEVLRKQMFEDPEPLTSLRPDIPLSVEKVVLKALEKNPNRRQQSALEVAKELIFSLREEGIIEEKTNRIKINLKDLAKHSINQGLSHLEKGEYIFAINCFTEAISYNFNDHNAHYFCGLAYQAANDMEEAIKCFDTVISLEPNRAEAYFKRALCYQNKNKLEQAIDDFSQTIKLDAKHQQAFYYRALNYKKLSCFEEAKEDLHFAIELDSRDALSYFNLACLYHYENELDIAFSSYSQAISLNPNHLESYVLRAFISKVKGDLDNAMIDCNLALQIDPMSQAAYFVRALIYLAKMTLDLKKIHELDVPFVLAELSDSENLAILAKLL